MLNIEYTLVRQVEIITLSKNYSVKLKDITCYCVDCEISKSANFIKIKASGYIESFFS